MSKKPFRPSLPTIPSSYYGDGPHEGVKEKLAEFLGHNHNTLPMYKDKPNPPGKKPINGNKLGLGLLVIFGMLWFGGLLRAPASFSAPGAGSTISWPARKQAVKKAFMVSWDHYAEHAWGMDQFHPVAQTSRNMGCKRMSDSCAPTGWIIVDALDTAMIMNLTSRVTKAREWIKTSLDFSKVDSEMSTFETTIRVLGGLLSAHYLSVSFPNLAPQRDDDVGAKGEDLYIEKATDLADRLLGAFDTPTGIPLSSCILNTSTGVGSHVDGGSASIAEATTVQLEMKYMSKLTGEPLYWERAEQVIAAVDSHRKEGGLLPIYINPQTGDFKGSNIRLGSRGDSYYEYLIKQYLQTGSRESVYLEMWEESLRGIKQHLVTWSATNNFTIIAERQTGLHEGLTGKMDHLVCFMPGTIALGLTHGKTVREAKLAMGDSWGPKQEEDLILAEELMKTCWGMYYVTPTGLAPEIAYFNLTAPTQAWNFENPEWTMPRSGPLDWHPRAAWRTDYDIHYNDVHNLQRPETIESLYYMWRITENPIYREWGWKIFQSFMKSTAIYDKMGKVVGYSCIQNVNTVTNPRSSNNKPLMVGDSVKRDNMEGFWLSETLKYLYLLFEDGDYEWNNLEKVVFNTEAHIFPRFDIGTEGKVWKTGWQRKEKKPATVG